jgi:ABC-type dipeptide/oligopeptide/nickel transport system ATPase subunit
MMLVARDLHYTYDHAPVLAGASITIAPGRIQGLAGPSGSGKSTLARILAGYLAPHSGQISIDGQPVARRGIHPVQMLFQTPELAVNPRWTIRDILSECHHPDEDLWQRFGLARAWLDRYPHELSGGELQRVSIVRALGPGVRFLIADEISGMLDTITQADIWQALASYIAARNIGVLAISHDEALLARIAAGVLRLEAGRVN